MIVKLRIRLARWLFRLSAKLAPEPEETEAYKSLPAELKEPRDASVEADDTIEQWSPDQKGNVVIVEPDIMHKFRRGKL